MLTEKKFKKITLLFSIILLLDYPVLPFFLSHLENKEYCEYDSLLLCFGLSLFLVTLIITFWLLVASSHYLMFFTNHYKVEGLGGGESKLLFFAKCFIYKKYFFGSIVGKIFTGGTTLAFVLGALYMFFYLSYSLIIKLLF